MTLRLRLAAGILLTAIPLSLGVLYVRAEAQRRAVEAELREYVEGAMQAGGRWLCELFPQRFGGEGSPMGAWQAEPPPMRIELPEGLNLPEGFELPPFPGADKIPRPPDPKPGQKVAIWAYDPQFTSANPKARAIPDALRSKLEAGERFAAQSFEWEGYDSIRVVMRMDWDKGPCAIVMAERQVEARLAEGASAVVWGVAILGAAVLGIVLLLAGPIVARIRSLGDQVKTSARSNYEMPVEAKGSDEIAALARDFNEAGRLVREHVESVEARRKTLQDFVANTTHDVMIPLTVLKGHLSGIHEALAAGDAPNDESVRGSLREAQYIGSLLHDLGAAAKLDAGDVALDQTDVDLGALVHRVAERHKPLAHSARIQLEFAVPEADVSTRGDVTLIEQAVNNLVHNAVRYGDEGGHVSLLLGETEGRFTITVWDDGPGVTEDELKRLAEPGYRASAARTRDPQGAGRGLAIAHEVAQRHGFELAFRRLDEGGLEASLGGPVSVRQ